ncbi:MAG: glutamate-5-semialdehyde dehydrogenase [Euryarchaeota archaeon]|nr:glutamate-5-semialdehyde dehydrogenase [Euryarchaeota archaeon]
MININEIGFMAKSASKAIGVASTATKNDALKIAAYEIIERTDKILKANHEDLLNAKTKDLPSAMLDRLMLNTQRLEYLSQSIINIANQEDPIGCILSEWQQPTGLTIKKVTTPIGVIGVIYESRPNVTGDAAALCIKSGNSVILRCGSECLKSSIEISKCFKVGLEKAKLPINTVQLIPTSDRMVVSQILGLSEYIDVIIPRGGKSLVSLVQEKARVPVFAHLEGICHIYIDKSADLLKSKEVVINSKLRRPGICGAVECLLIDDTIKSKVGRILINDLLKKGVEVRGDKWAQTINGVTKASSNDYGREFLDKIIAVKVVNGVHGAIQHIEEFGSNHTECIMAEDEDPVREFFTNVDSAILLNNASTQFADGGEFGMGAEIGIATGKLHARGPVGAKQLSSFKYLVCGNGTTRQ